MTLLRDLARARAVFQARTLETILTEGNPMTDTLADALPREIDRVTAKRDRWIKIAADHPEMASGMNITIAFMQNEIMAAVRALASGDVTEMMSAHESLKGYSDDD